MTDQAATHDTTHDTPAAPSARELRQTIVEHYGARARQAVERAGDEAPEAAAAGDACCAPAGEAAPAAIEFIDVAAEGGSADASCGPDGCAIDGAEAGVSGTIQFGAALYDGEELGDTPEAARLAAAGCGNPVAIAELRSGESVLDLGSGGGIDCFLAARQVGDGGEVWGLDMTPDMVQLARHNAEQVGAANVRFRLGEIEDIPFAGETFDTLISNCVINLSTDKPQVFREAFRVLKGGGRLRVSDMVRTRELTGAEAIDAEQWAGCIAGALHVDEYAAGLREAGFTDVAVEPKSSGDSGIASADITATKPA